MADFQTVRRHLEAPLREALAAARVVFLDGARQTGKSTLAAVVAGTSRDYLTLDDAAILAGAKNDPMGFVGGLSDAVVIDEVQRAPELFLAIKMSVDRDRRPGRFLVTGSANALLLPRLADALVGRMRVVTLWPFSQGEIEGIREGFVDAVFGADAPAVARGITRAEAIERVVRGGYPEPVTRGVDGGWYGAYITTLLHRDVRDLANVEQLGMMPALLELLAARAGSLLNTAELSRSAALPHNTLRRYLALLETLFIVHRLPAWSGSATKRLAKAPKPVLADTGLMAHLLRATPAHLQSAPTLLGPLLENFIAMEVRKQAGWSEASIRMFHYRSHSGDEVDLGSFPPTAPTALL